jgi:hypothetical protein
MLLFMPKIDEGKKEGKLIRICLEACRGAATSKHQIDDLAVRESKA